MILSKPNPKALNLDGLDSMSKKVTIGFKCNPKIKLQLANDAKIYGLTLSEYVENLLLTVENHGKPETSEIIKLKNEVAFYENDILKSFYYQYEGQEISFQTPDGEECKIKIIEPKDIYTIIINSFKIKK